MNRRFIFQLLLLLFFIIGLFVYSTVDLKRFFHRDGFFSVKSECPDVLVFQGGKYQLYNKLNPEKNTVFNTLDEYTQFQLMQKTKGIHCPTLFLQQEYTAQGTADYRIRPSPYDLQGGLPVGVEGLEMPQDANRDNPPYNQGMYSGFDPNGMYVGKYTKLDQIHESTASSYGSDNPMDPNWLGVQHTEQVIKSGKYDKHLVYAPTYPHLGNTFYDPSIINPYLGQAPTVPI